MSTPVTEKEQFSFPAFQPNQPSTLPQTQPQIQTQHPSIVGETDRRSSDEDGTLHGERTDDYPDHNHLRVTTSYLKGDDHLGIGARDNSPMSPSAQREQSRRLNDDLEMLRAERVVSNAEKSMQDEMSKNMSRNRSRSRTNAEPQDDFDVGTTPIHEQTKVYRPPAHPTTNFAKVFKKIHQSSFLIRYFFYITPLTLVLLVPVLVGRLVFRDANVGGVRLFWFGIWLEVVWLTLWAARIIAKCIPYPLGLIASVFTNNAKKWRDMGKQLEVAATLFFWWLAIEISFLPTMKNHHVNGDKTTKNWETIVNKVIIAGLVAASLNFFEKIIIQLIAISFHLRTYADRIEINKFQISSLVKLYVYSKEKIAMEDSEFEVGGATNSTAGARTPMQYAIKAQKNARQAFNKVGDVAGKVAGDFTGKQVATSTHPHQVILQLLSSTGGAQVLARRLYRTFVQGEEAETVLSDDLKPAFDNDDEANAAFTMFDKDLNGDISMEELEAVCVEIGRERKAITASLKDLDSVVSKLDDIFMFIVAIITILVFVSIISTSASGVLTSLGSSVLALSWLFSATAQEFLQSCIFVFVKHPFDVGDRVTIYGNTGAQMKGDDYFVKEIALLYTEFKKMEGHVVQAPNSYLNTLFILNQRRSGGLAEAVPVTIKFGTTLEQIDSLRERLLEFVGSENREYQKNILTELREVYEAYSVTLNVVFFYKSNWQNELLRLQRRNKFICALMVTMQELNIEGPRMKLAGAAPEWPMHLQGAFPTAGGSVNSQQPGPDQGQEMGVDPPFVPQADSATGSFKQHPSILRNRNGSVSVGGRGRGESLGQLSKRVDFSLGMSAISSGADFGDVYDDPTPRMPIITTTSPSPGPGRNGSRDGRPSDDGGSLGKTSSRDSFGRVTSANSQRTHRNRFFGRNKSKLNQEEGTDLDELEAGTRDFGTMPGIPEISGPSTGTNTMNFDPEKDSYGRPRAGTASSSRIDPRSGIVSPQAVSRDSALERGELPMAFKPRRAATDSIAGAKHR